MPVVSHIETSPFICFAIQWTGFHMIGTSVMKELMQKLYVLTSFPNRLLKKSNTDSSFSLLDLLTKASLATTENKDFEKGSCLFNTVHTELGSVWILPFT